MCSVVTNWMSRSHLFTRDAAESHVDESSILAVRSPHTSSNITISNRIFYKHNERSYKVVIFWHWRSPNPAWSPCNETQTWSFNPSQQLFDLGFWTKAVILRTLWPWNHRSQLLTDFNQTVDPQEFTSQTISFIFTAASLFTVLAREGSVKQRISYGNKTKQKKLITVLSHTTGLTFEEAWGK